MTADNLDLGPDAQVNHAIALLRSGEAHVSLADGVTLAPGVFLAVDAEGDVSGKVSIGDDSLVSLDYTVRDEPRWISMHVGMGGVDLGQAAIFGIGFVTGSPPPITASTWAGLVF